MQSIAELGSADAARAAVDGVVGGLMVGRSTVDEAAIPAPLGYMVLVEPVQIEEYTAGGIALAATTIRDREHLRQLARVVAVGPAAFRGDDTLLNWGDIEPGDWVLHDCYNGFLFPVVDAQGRRGEYRVIKDNQIWARVPDPNAVLQGATRR